MITHKARREQFLKAMTTDPNGRYIYSLLCKIYVVWSEGPVIDRQALVKLLHLSKREQEALDSLIGDEEFEVFGFHK